MVTTKLNEWILYNRTIRQEINIPLLVFNSEKSNKELFDNCMAKAIELSEYQKNNHIHTELLEFEFLNSLSDVSDVNKSVELIKLKAGEVLSSGLDDGYYTWQNLLKEYKESIDYIVDSNIATKTECETLLLKVSNIAELANMDTFAKIEIYQSYIKNDIDEPIPFSDDEKESKLYSFLNPRFSEQKLFSGETKLKRLISDLGETYTKKQIGEISLLVYDSGILRSNNKPKTFKQWYRELSEMMGKETGSYDKNKLNNPDDAIKSRFFYLNLENT